MLCSLLFEDQSAKVVIFYLGFFSVMKVMKLKVQGYLLKTMPPEQIVKTIDEFFENQKAMK